MYTSICIKCICNFVSYCVFFYDTISYIKSNTYKNTEILQIHVVGKYMYINSKT